MAKMKANLAPVLVAAFFILTDLLVHVAFLWGLWHE